MQTKKVHFKGVSGINALKRPQNKQKTVIFIVSSDSTEYFTPRKTLLDYKISKDE